MQKSGWILGILAALAGLMPEVQVQVCSGLHAAMSRGEPPRSADVVAVLGGGGGARIRRGLGLLKAGYAPHILFLGTTPEMEFATSLARATRAWAPDRIRFGARASQTTSECVEELVDWCRRHGVRTAMVISDDRHLGRVELHLEELAAGELETVLVASLKQASFDSPDQRLLVLREAGAHALAWLVRITAALRP